MRYNICGRKLATIATWQGCLSICLGTQDILVMEQRLGNRCQGSNRVGNVAAGRHWESNFGQLLFHAGIGILAICSSHMIE